MGQAHLRPPHPRWPPPVSSLINCAYSPAHQTHFRAFPQTGFTVWTGIPHCLFSTSYLTLCSAFYLSSVTPCPPLIPSAGRPWPGLCPSQKSSTVASVMVLIKTKLFYTSTTTKNPLQKSKLENLHLCPYPAVKSSLLKQTHTASLTQNRSMELSTQTRAEQQAEKKWCYSVTF